MRFSRKGLLIAAAVLAGCQSDQQFLDSKQSAALETAVSRARFEMNCPQATGEVLSREVMQPVVGPAMGGVSRAQYTIGISGCGQRTTSVVLCPDGGSGCFAADGRDAPRFGGGGMGGGMGGMR